MKNLLALGALCAGLAVGCDSAPPADNGGGGGGGGNTVDAGNGGGGGGGNTDAGNGGGGGNTDSGNGGGGGGNRDAGGTTVTPPPPPVNPTPVTEIPGHETMTQDNSPKEGPRLMPQETLIRSYLQLFGGLSPMAFQQRLRGTPTAGQEVLFDTWGDYLSALGVPDYSVDIPRGTQSNALMLSAFERIGAALCERAVENDLRGAALADHVVFRFNLPAGRAVTDAEFATNFDGLHRAFLGYPASLAPATRVTRFRQLYRDASARHEGAGANRTSFNGPQAGWAVVCQGLIRHPEFHLY